MNRPSFIFSLSATAAAAFLRNVALADAPNHAYSISSLVETILPITERGFPDVTTNEIVTRIESLYHLDGAGAFQGSLATFMQPGYFVEPNHLLFAVERSVIPDVDVLKATNVDAQAYNAALLPKTGSFEAFTESQRGTYLRLWSQSAFTTRRRFYQSVRFITFAAFYSMPHVWPAIGYAGPLLSEKRR